MGFLLVPIFLADCLKVLVILRPIVVFGEGNRGNVDNLLNQIKLGAFAMIGNGKNKKSMAYVGNLAVLLVKRIELNERYA